MFKQSLTLAVRVARQPARTISTTVSRRAEGSTGSSSGGRSDSFTKREEASEAMYIRNQEREKLQKLKDKLKNHENDVASVKKEIDSLEKSSK